ncbi:MFS transporter [Promicromonospora sp. NPDC023987]|uniref:MFS transporter n=1 Tax=Promicromonospora sp. NPDC023987 TaxID=3155360 RepID=UPI0033DDE9AE
MHRRPYVQLGLIAATQVLAMAMWFSASAVLPTLRETWHLDGSQAGWLTATVQLGFVAGALTSAVLNLPDRLPPQHLLAASAVGAAAATATIALFVSDFGTAVALRFVTGFFLAGVYPVGMKLMTSWFGSTGRGLALGVLVGALTLGSALPHLVNASGTLPWQNVLLTASGLGVAAAIVATVLVRSGPHTSSGSRPHPRYVLEMFRRPQPRDANLGYFGHMWELYALWTWMATFILAAAPAHGQATGLLTFTAIGAAGLAGSLLGGWAADRFGRARTAGTALVVSGSCCLLSPLFYLAPWPVLVAFLMVWGASVIADSGVFSTALSEVVDQRYVGTALTAQTAIGFLITVLTINLVPITADVVGWQYAFLVLVPGPVVGALAMRAFGKRPASAHA